MTGRDPYSRVDYRRLIAWPERIRREAPLLESVLGSGPSRRVLDLGCGTGEHSRFLVSRGFEVVGVDASQAMLEKAREEPLPDGLELVAGEIQRVEELTEGEFGGAICLGNTLPHLRGDDDLEAFLGGLRRRLAPGGPFLLQILNYRRILDRGVRHLPLNVRPGPEGEPSEIVFLRLLKPGADGRMLFFPTSLRFDPDADPPVEVAHSRRVELRAWLHDEIDSALEAAGFPERRAWGGFDRRPFAPGDSYDLILLAR